MTSGPGMVRLSWEMPDTWAEVPEVGSADFALWREQLLVTAPAEARRALEDDLRRLEEYRAAAGSEPGAWLAAVLPTALGGPRILVVGRVDLHANVDVDEVAARWRADAQQPPARVLSRRVATARKSGRDVVTLTDLVGDENATLHERCLAFTRDPRSGLGASLDMNTTDMAAFEDIAEVCADVLASLRLVPEGES